MFIGDGAVAVSERMEEKKKIATLSRWAAAVFTFLCVEAVIFFILARPQSAPFRLPFTQFVNVTGLTIYLVVSGSLLEAFRRWRIRGTADNAARGQAAIVIIGWVIVLAIPLFCWIVGSDMTAAVPSTHSVKLEHYEYEARGGNIRAMCKIGAFFEKPGVYQNFQKSMLWYNKAAAGGSAQAMAAMGTFYQKGEGVPKNYGAALAWYRMGANGYSRRAMCSLGWFYEKGLQVPQDYAKAMAWYRKAAAAGSGMAMYNIGWLYQNGEGVAIDEIKARKWYERAAASGDPKAARLAKEKLVEIKAEGR